jgi:hypothetical protein
MWTGRLAGWLAGWLGDITPESLCSRTIRCCVCVCVCVLALVLLQIPNTRFEGAAFPRICVWARWVWCGARPGRGRTPWTLCAHIHAPQAEEPGQRARVDVHQHPPRPRG